MSEIYFAKTTNSGQACLKIINESGIELSLAGDDSCGTSEKLWRTSLARFKGPLTADMIEHEQFAITPEDFLKTLADHLGYNIVKK